MEAVLDRNPRRNSIAFARDRDRLLLWLLDRHPATAGMLAGIGLFPSAKKANRRLLRLVRRRKIVLLGTVCLKSGRPEHVYGRARWMRKPDTLLHEVQITLVLCRIDAGQVRRGPGEVDVRLLADAELLIGGKRYFLELDRGTMAVTEVVRKRFTKYTSTTDFVLWVCPTQNRLEALRRHAVMLRTTALFTTLDQALQNPHGGVWRDFDGTVAALPREANPHAPTRPQPEEKSGTFSPPGGGVAAPPVAKELPMSRETLG